MFVFSAAPQVPADNNGAERSLPDLVVSRKISGGTRSAEGTAPKRAFALVKLHDVDLEVLAEEVLQVELGAGGSKYA